MKELSQRTKDLIHQGRTHYAPVYSQREMILDHGKGVYLWDLDGNEYLDMGSGIAVNSLGYADPDLEEAIITQTKKLLHTSNVFFTEPMVELVTDLVKCTFADKVFLCNSGAEANEAAIKLARKYASVHHGPEKREIITFNKSFHGRTLATVTASAQAKLHQGFAPLPTGFAYCDYNNIEALEQAISEKTCAVLLEPIQGEGGIIVPDAGYLKQVRELADRHDALVIFDEIQSGLGRTGKLFAHEWDGVTPDILANSKPLGGGLPLGAMLATEKVASAFKVGDHGSTFGGNPVACASARVMLRKINQPAFLKNVEERGHQLQTALKTMGEELELFSEIRGRGLMIGAELKEKWHGKARDMTETCRHHGVLVLQAGANVLRLVPPLTLTEADAEEAMSRMSKALKAYTLGV